jgi:hypothetical protein
MHQRVHRLGVAALVLALVALVGVAYAQSAVTGTVLSVDPQARSVSVKTDAGTTQTFLLADPIWMRSAGKDISVSELKVGDRVRIEPSPAAGTDQPTQTATRLEVLGSGTQSGTGQRTVSTERPVLGESPDAGEDRNAMPSSAGSTTGRTVSTDRPVLGQKPSQDTATTGSAPTSTTTGTPGTSGTYGTPTYGSSTPPPSTPTTGTHYGTSGTSASSASSSARADELPATASPLPMIGVLGLFALAAGFAARAIRKQHS